MNYFLLVLILAAGGGAYYVHTQDQQQIETLQAQLAAAQKAPVAAALPPVAPSTPQANPGATTVPPSPGGVAGGTKTRDLDAAPPQLSGASAPAAPLVPLKVIQPEPSHSSAIDAAAQAAQAAANSASLGTITTLDNHTYNNCKVLKVESDGVTFSHDDGITKILYPMMSPDLQQKFGYSPQAAVAQTEAQIRAEQQQTAVTNAPATP